MNKIPLGNLCTTKIDMMSSDTKMIDYVDISSVDNATKQITGYVTYTGNEAPSRAKQLIENGDILVSTVRPNLNAVALCDLKTDNQLVASTGFCVLRPKEAFDAQFLYYISQSKHFVGSLMKVATGASYPAVNKNDVRSVLIPDYSKEQRSSIAKQFAFLQRIIMARKQQLSALDTLIKARFVEMFGDPVSNPFKWKTMTFRDASVRLSDGPFGSNLKSEHYSDAGVRIIRLGNIGVGEFLDKDKSFIPLDHYERLKKYTCKAGEIVIGTLGEPNLRACIIPEYVNYAINKADCVHYIPKPEMLNTQFVCQYINCPELLLLAAGAVHGQTRSRVSSGQLAELTLFIPPLELQNQFATFVSQVDKSKAAVQKALDEAQVLFDSLMQKYFG